jgi:nucleotide-binding universal stress UspA family protein
METCSRHQNRRIEINTILLACKLKPSNVNAFLTALALARGTESSLEVLLVLPPDKGPPGAVQDAVAEKTRAAETRFEKNGRPLLGDYDRCRFSCRIGDPAGEIISFAKECDADLIVLGCHHRDDRPSYNRLGEVAQIVFQWAPCAAMLVPCQA